MRKKRAFEALANQIDRILNPADNVIPMRTEIPAQSRITSGPPWRWSTKAGLTHHQGTIPWQRLTRL
jgi:hypothetical protein